VNDVIEDLPLSRRGRNRNLRFPLDLPNLSNNACTLLEKGHDLLIGVVNLFSAGLKPDFRIGDLLAVASDRTAEQER
jgi:hypothetical protein